MGHFQDTKGVHGFLLNESGFTAIDLPGVRTFLQAYGINATGEIVGFYYDSAWKAHGFLRDKWGGMTSFDVDIPGASNTVVWRNNARGDLVGKYDASGSSHGFLITR